MAPATDAEALCPAPLLCLQPFHGVVRFGEDLCSYPSGIVHLDELANVYLSNGSVRHHNGPILPSRVYRLRKPNNFSPFTVISSKDWILPIVGKPFRSFVLSQEFRACQEGLSQLGALQEFVPFMMHNPLICMVPH